MLFLTPKWKKQAKLLSKGATKFLNYKRDLLEPAQVSDIKSRIDDLKGSIKSGDKEKAREISENLESVCEKALPRHKPLKGVAENVEVFFVAIVIALGLRAYYLQPFRIPTGSMRPTLNGIIGHKLDKDKWPSAAQRMAEKLSHGRSYVYAESAQDDEILKIEEYQSFKFFTRTKITFRYQEPIVLSSSKTAIMRDFGLANILQTSLSKEQEQIQLSTEHGQPARDRMLAELNLIGAVVIDGRKEDSKGKPLVISRGIRIPKGTILAQGHVDTGDLVLVDKFSYHFRKPTRGEVFVFDTRNIPKTQGDHYIKRLVGVPGDTIEIDGDTGLLYVNGKVAEGEGLQYSMGLEFNRDRLPSKKGYELQPPIDASFLNTKTPSRKIAGEEKGMRAEYLGFGDNTSNSQDSRSFGTVKEYNLVGPALFTLWPFRHKDYQHWGLIK